MYVTQIVNAKYQQIIGSRYICDIIDYKEQQS